MLRGLSFGIFFVFHGYFLYARIVSPEERPETYFDDLSLVLSGIKLNAPELLEHAMDVEVADARVSEASSHRGFQVRARASGESIREDRSSQSGFHRNRALASLYLSKPIYHWGALAAEEEIARIQKSSVGFDFAETEKSLLGETRAKFLDLVIMNMDFQLSATRLLLADKRASEAKSRLELDLSAPVDLENAEIDRLNEEIAFSEKNASLNRLIGQFRALTGFEEKLNLSPSEKFLRFCSNHDFTRSFPVLVSTEVSSARISSLRSLSLQEEQRIIQADASLLPKINFIGAFYQDQVDSYSSQSSLDRNNLIVGVEANWNLWDSGKSKAQKKAALARKSKHELALEREKRIFLAEVESSRRSLISVGERIALTRRLMQVAKNRLEKSEMQFEQKRLSSAAVLSAKLGLEEARLSNLSAVVEYLKILDLYDQMLFNESNE